MTSCRARLLLDLDLVVSLPHARLGALARRVAHPLAALGLAEFQQRRRLEEAGADDQDAGAAPGDRAGAENSRYPRISSATSRMRSPPT